MYMKYVYAMKYYYYSILFFRMKASTECQPLEWLQETQ